MSILIDLFLKSINVMKKQFKCLSIDFSFVYELSIEFIDRKV